MRKTISFSQIGSFFYYSFLVFYNYQTLKICSFILNFMFVLLVNILLLYFSDKEGPIHSVCWSPLGNEFGVVYGFMPAKVALINSKCEIVHDFGSGPRNSIYFNPHGNNILFFILYNFNFYSTE